MNSYTKIVLKFIKSGFTLSEILITLGIIGIVAAIVIPTIVHTSQDQALKAAWKKNYSMFAQAYQRVKYDNDNNLSEFFPDSGSGTYLSNDAIRQIEAYLKPTLTCYVNVSIVCGSSPSISLGDRTNNAYKTLNNGYLDDDDLANNQCVLQNGANVYTRTYHNNVANIYVDVNGFSKGPNVLGKDLFGINITKDKIQPMGASGTERTSMQTVNCSTSDTFVPLGASMQASDYTGAACSMKYLFD